MGGFVIELLILVASVYLGWIASEKFVARYGWTTGDVHVISVIIFVVVMFTSSRLLVGLIRML